MHTSKLYYGSSNLSCDKGNMKRGKRKMEQETEKWKHKKGKGN